MDVKNTMLIIFNWILATFQFKEYFKQPELRVVIKITQDQDSSVDSSYVTSSCVWKGKKLDF